MHLLRCFVWGLYLCMQVTEPEAEERKAVENKESKCGVHGVWLAIVTS